MTRYRSALSVVTLAASLLVACKKPPPPPVAEADLAPKATIEPPAPEAHSASGKHGKKDREKKKLARPQKAAPEPKTEGCGSIIVGGEPMDLDCEDHTAPGQHDGVDVVSREALERDPKRAGGYLLPAEVDHREEGTEGPMRNQGRAGSCTCFALAAAIDHAMIRHEKKAYEVSSLHLWSRFHHGAGLRPIDSNYGVPITSETSWPYDQTLACEWESQKDCKGCKIEGKHVDCKQPVDPKLEAIATGKPYARIIHVTRVDAATTLDRKRILARGQDMFFGMKINGAAFHEAKGGDHVIADFDLDAPGGGGHAMVISGYHEEEGGTYFLIHNSWGEKFGDKGYAWIHETMLKRGVMIVEALPDGATLLGINPPRKPPAACTAGKAPDTATLVCAALCPDGGPMFGGACPVAASCEAGEVSVRGACVASAPTIKGEVSASKVTFDCHPGGCVYTLPKGQASCESASCAFSCAAPAFILESGKEGVFCSE